MYVCMCVHVCACVYVCQKATQTIKAVYMYVCMYECMHVCVCVYICQKATQTTKAVLAKDMHVSVYMHSHAHAHVHMYVSHITHIHPQEPSHHQAATPALKDSTTKSHHNLT